jgi:glycerol-3-phosphate acyltransferase PlsY
MGRTILTAVAVLGGAYLLGAIPFSLIVGKLFFRTDLRERGSGNLGATNMFRELGWPAGLAVALLDMAKGAAAVFLAKWLVGATGADVDRGWFLLLVVFAAMAGHTYSPYIRFRGGKGIATAGGALLVTMPLGTLLLLGVFVALISVTRTVSVASVTVAVAFPFVMWASYSHDPIAVALAVAAAALAIWRHRANISRIIKGTEPRIGRRSADADEGSSR